MVEAGPGWERPSRERTKVGREERVKMVDRNGAVGRARASVYVQRAECWCTESRRRACTYEREIRRGASCV